MPVKIHVRSTAYGQSPNKLFELKKTSYGTGTVVKIKRLKCACYEITLDNVSWSKYRFVNKIKKLFIRLKYR